MTIAETNIKLFAPQRLTDDPDGGGSRTPVVVQDGVKNNLFPDLGSVDRGVGALHPRKAFMAIAQAGAETLRNATLSIDVLPGDPATSAVLAPATALNDTRDDVVAAINAQGLEFPFKGTVALAAQAALNSASLQLSSLRVPFVPMVGSLAANTGDLPAVEVAGYETAGAPLPFSAFDASTVSVWQTALQAPAALNNPVVIVAPGGWSGTYTSASNPPGVISSDDDSVNLSGSNGEHFEGALLPSTRLAATTLVLNTKASGASAATAVAGTYQRSMRVDLVRQTISVPITSANRSFTYTLDLPAGTSPGTESVTVYSSLPMPSHGASDSTEIAQGYRTASQIYRSRLGESKLVRAGSTEGDYNPSFVVADDSDLNHVASATINRVTGKITLVMRRLLDAGTSIVISFAAGGVAQARSQAELSNAGVITATTVQVTLPSGHRLNSASFKVGSFYYFAREGAVYPVSSSTPAGGFDADTGVFTLPALDGQTVEEFAGLSTPSTASVSNLVATLPASLDASTLSISGTTAALAPFTAASNSLGVFSTAIVSGLYSQDGTVALTFSEPVQSASITWSADQSTFAPTGADLGGILPGALADDGQVQVIRETDLILIHHTASLPPATVVNSDTFDAGRGRLAQVRIIGNDGTVHATFKSGQPAPVGVGITVDLIAGTGVFTDVSGLSQPVTVEHRIEDLAQVSQALASGSIGLSRRTSHLFPVGTLVSSLLRLGDLGARAHEGFAQDVWTGEWSDELIGSAPLWSFNQAAHPIQVSNLGTDSDRWVCLFTSSTAFRIIGEQTGEIAGPWSTLADASPINPATLSPLFTIPAAGWGSGQSAGDVFRFNTTGAAGPGWVFRSTVPSDPFPGEDSLLLSMRGDSNS